MTVGARLWSTMRGRAHRSVTGSHTSPNSWSVSGTAENCMGQYQSWSGTKTTHYFVSFSWIGKDMGLTQ